MPPDLEIKVLFCYSPEVLANTYNNIAELEADNQKLCNLTEDILKHNVISFGITLTKLVDFQFATLQKQWGINYAELSTDQTQELVESPAVTGIINSLKFGDTPKILLDTKKALGASIVVLQTVLRQDEVGCPRGVLGAASEIDITKPEEAFVIIGRKVNVKGQTTCSISPLVLAHEFGHLMGCRHPYGTGRGFDPESGDSHGHYLLDQNGQIVAGTIMSYAKNRVPYYSDPNLFAYPPPYQNEPCGEAGVSQAFNIVNNNVQKLAGIFTP